MNCKDSTSALAAVFVSCDEIHINRYVQLKTKLQDVFSRQFIDGSVFMHAGKRVREDLIQTIMPAISSVVHDPVARNPSIELEQFLREAIE